MFQKLGEKLDKTIEKAGIKIEDIVKEVGETFTDLKSKTTINGIEIQVDEDKNVKIKGEVKSISLNDTEIYKK